MVQEKYKNQIQNQTTTGDMVVVETDAGYDIGHITLSGDLVRLQMKKKKVNENAVIKNVIRRANERDLDRLSEARQKEQHTMVRARAIARTLDLEMKVGDVEYQADNRKATFYYTAEGRVDFRELIRHYAKEFKVKIEMRQIGARQESARIGGIGSCGRELCCSTWLSDFKTVSTTAARYQNLAINQAKLSGQCGRLKCCLNYELDTYMDALEAFPNKADKLKTEVGEAFLMKTDIFKGLMFYAYRGENMRGKIYPVEIERVKEIQAMNQEGKLPMDLIDMEALIAAEEADNIDFDAVNDVIELPPEERKRRRKKKNKSRSKNKNNKTSSKNTAGSKSDKDKKDSRSEGTKNKSKSSKSKSSRYKSRSKKDKSTSTNGTKPTNGGKSKSNGTNKTTPQKQSKSDTKPVNKNNGSKPQNENKKDKPPKKKRNFFRSKKKKSPPPKKD